jgi:hypothetical protein
VLRTSSSDYSSSKAPQLLALSTCTQSFNPATMLFPAAILVATLVGAQTVVADVTNIFIGWDAQDFVGNSTILTSTGVYHLDNTIRSFAWFPRTKQPSLVSCCLRTCPLAGWDKQQLYCNSTVISVLPEYQFNTFTTICGGEVILPCQ